MARANKMETNKTVRIAKNEVKAKLEAGIEVLYKNKFRVDKIEQFEGEEKLFLTFLETKSESVVSFERCEGYFYVKPSAVKQTKPVKKPEQIMGNTDFTEKPAKVKAPVVDKEASKAIANSLGAEVLIVHESRLLGIEFANGYHSMFFDLDISDEDNKLHVARKLQVPINYLRDFDRLLSGSENCSGVEYKSRAKAFITGKEETIKKIVDAKGMHDGLIRVNSIKFANGYHSLAIQVRLVLNTDEGSLHVDKEVLVPLSYTKDFN